jgi:FeS assembly protein IscX
MAKKSVKKLKWDDVEDVAFRLIDEHPQVDPSRLAIATVVDMVRALPDFGEATKKPSKDTVEAIQERWAEERDDMVDELGPLEEFQEELDEDEYRSDRMVDEEGGYSDSDKEEDDEEEEDDGFEPLDEDSDDEEEAY